MNRIPLSDIEAIRVMRCQGNLRVRGVAAAEASLTCDSEPQMRKLEQRAEILIPSNAEMELPAGVTLEILDCAGNLDVEDYGGPLSLGRVRGNLRARRIGSLAIRGEIDGEAKIEDAQGIEGEQINGNLRVDNARALRFHHVSGNVECRAVEGEVELEDVLGRLRVAGAGAVRAQRVSGKLEVERVASLDAMTAAGKVKAVEVAGDVKLGRVGGRLSVDDVAGALAAQYIGGHVGLRGVHGAVDLPDVGGAVDLLGPLPSAGAWNITSRGRISVEISADTSAAIDARARYGRVRMYGVPESGFTRSSRDRVEGVLGGGGLKLNLEATDADIILFGEDIESHEYDGRRRARDFRFGRRFSAPFEAFADDIREDIPGFVSEIVGAAGKIVTESGRFTGGIAQEVTRSVGDAMREVERTLADLEHKVPRDVGDKLSRLGRRISDVVERAMDDARERRRESRGHSRERRDEAPHAEGASEAAGQPHDDTMLKILKAVREGTLKPEEADSLISAWIELRRSSRDEHAD
jgi:hypothetical protein